MTRYPARLALALFAAAGLFGCDQDPYTLVIVEGGMRDLGNVDAEVCVVTNNGVEACDEVDNDCDGDVDEDFDLLSDPENCGRCRRTCQGQGTLSACESGLCKSIGCAPGFIDLNQDIEDGCEYECTPSGDELCDGKDNNCDGEVDETFDLTNDVANCGACGDPCQLANANARCERGECKVQNCVEGFIDKDADSANGCEEPCARTNDGNEVCDGLDNDCNGVVDDPGGLPIDFANDPLNCGSCGQVCAFSHASVACRESACVLVDCIEPWLDTDGEDGNGCECEPGPEICDGRDNDCDGRIDNDLPAVLGSCGTDTGACELGRLVCRSGQPVCEGGKGRSAELCNKIDDDCNGTPDDNLPASYGPCGTSEGECEPGNLVCREGVLDCEGDREGTQEICDGRDNDCDGQVDEAADITNLGKPCGSDVGECSPGVFRCDVANRTLTCRGNVGPAYEMCGDGKDSDCNGRQDVPDPADPQNAAKTYCLASASGRERRLDEPSGGVALGANNSTQLSLAGAGQQLIAVWLDRRNDRGDVFANLSSDGGRTWRSSDIGVATESNSKAEPQVAWGGVASGTNRRAYVTYSRTAAGDRRDIYARRSTNSGTSWGSALRIDAEARDSLYVQIAVRPGQQSGQDDVVVICWEEIYTSGATRPNVFCARSTDSGATYSAKVQVNQLAENAIVPRLAIDDTYVYVTWSQGSEIHVARADHTASTFAFDSETRLSGANPAREPRIATDGAGAVLVVWEDLPAQAPIDLYASRSTNRGASWAGPTRVDTMVINGDSTDAAIAMEPGPNGRSFVIWEDTTRGKKDIYANYSDNAGASWQPVPRQVSATEPGQHASSDPVIAIEPAGKRVYAAWIDQRNSSGPGSDVYFGFSLDEGDHWNIPDLRLNENTAGVAQTRTPFIWPGHGAATVVWVDQRTGTGGTLNGPNGDIYASYAE